MPHQYGLALPGFGQAPPSPPQHGALIPRLNVGAGSGTLQPATSFRGQTEDKRLTRDAMERYLRDRNDMIIVILHAKVIILFSFII